MAYKEMDAKTLKKLHEVELEILIEIDRVCQKYNIPYFLCGGTLIGVQRHKGFIPWDDDIDIGMLRKDYERFKTCFLKEKLTDYYLHSHETDDKYWLPFMKIRKNNTTINEKFVENLVDVHKGIFVDIFPFDKVPDDGFNKKLKFRAFFIKLIVEAIFCKRKVYKCKDSRRPLLTFIMTLLPCNLLIKIQYKLMTKDNEKNYKHCICFVGSYNTSKEYIKISDIYPLKKGLFEKHKFSIPGNYDVYLTNLYGDYMKLPPKDKRKNHNPVDIKFDEGMNIINNETIC